MKRLAIVLVMALVVGMASVAVADKPVGGILRGPSTGGAAGTVPEGRNDYIDGWNVDEPVATGVTYTSACFALVYQPALSYWLDRIEFVAGGNAGPSWISVLVDNGTGEPNGDLLGTGYFEQFEDIVWQGADFAPCIYLEQGMTYYIHYGVVVGSQASVASSGVMHPHYHQPDCTGTWSGPWTDSNWMIKFFGGFEPSPTESDTWGSIKVLYR